MLFLGFLRFVESFGSFAFGGYSAEFESPNRLLVVCQPIVPGWSLPIGSYVLSVVSWNNGVLNAVILYDLRLNGMGFLGARSAMLRVVPPVGKGTFVSNTL